MIKQLGSGNNFKFKIILTKTKLISHNILIIFET